MTAAFRATRLGLILMAALAIVMSIYPAIFAFIPGADGLFISKAAALLASQWYKPVFYIHIGFGGLALLVGSTQFFKGLRNKRLNLHRNLGKVYVVSVLFSGIAGLIVAFYATGGWISVSGFFLLAVGWLYTTARAYKTIRKGEVKAHQIWMMRSYAFCFSAVTLRIYLGIGVGIGLLFSEFYHYLAWLCWVPNLIFVEYRIKRLAL